MATGAPMPNQPIARGSGLWSEIRCWATRRVSVIEFEAVGKIFRNGASAITDLSLTAPADQITAIVGPSGSGKTTALRLINRMVEPTRGKISWDGSPVRSRRKTALRRQMGYVSQRGRPLPAPHRGGEHPDGARPAGLVQGQGPQAVVRVARSGRSGTLAGAPVSRPTDREPAAAGGDRPGAGRGSEGAAPGRAVRRRGFPGPQRTARVPDRSAGSDQQDDRAGHRRCRRGPQARRPGGDPAGGRPSRPGGYAAAAAGRAR